MAIKQVPVRPKRNRVVQQQVSVPPELVAQPGPPKHRLNVTPEVVTGAVPKIAAVAAGLGLPEINEAQGKALVLGVDPLAPVVAEALVEQVLPSLPEVSQKAGVKTADHDVLVQKWDAMADLHQSAQQLQQDLSDSRDTVAMVQRSEREEVQEAVEQLLSPGSQLREDVRAELEADWAPVKAKLEQIDAAKKAQVAQTKKQTQAGQAQQAAAQKQATLLQTMIDLRRNAPVAQERIDEAAQIYAEQGDGDLLEAGGVAEPGPGGSGAAKPAKATHKRGAAASSGAAASAPRAVDRRKKTRG